MKSLIAMDTTTTTTTTTSATQTQHLSSNTPHFHWPNHTNNKVVNEDFSHLSTIIEKEKTSATNESKDDNNNSNNNSNNVVTGHATTRKKLQAVAISKVRSVLTVFSKNRSNNTHIPFGLGSRVVGTLFGYRRGHVHIAFQKDPTSQPAFLIELATPITGLVREMASGLVRIALECDKHDKKEEASTEKKKKMMIKTNHNNNSSNSVMRLLQEPLWRTYCNGKKCGFASRRECGAKDWEILKAVEPISMGAGVLPAPAVDSDNNNKKDNKEKESDGEVMYMRARFERIVGSRDSEAFYMMNPDSNGAPELSIYLLRV